jgi:hypothetical protein
VDPKQIFPSSFTPADSGFQLLYIVFWGGAVVATLVGICQNGPEFVNNPRLMQGLKTT